METNSHMIEALFEKTEKYTRTTAELYKLKAIEKSADVISTLSVRLVVFVFISLFFLIMNIGVALWIGELLGKAYFGFFIVAGFYALIGLVLFLIGNRWIKEPLRNSIILQALN